MENTVGKIVIKTDRSFLFFLSPTGVQDQSEQKQGKILWIIHFHSGQLKSIQLAKITIPNKVV
jgi:hypothetical protein